MKLSRIDAIKILDIATDQEDANWEHATAEFCEDEYGEDMPTIFDVFAALGITKEEYRNATGNHDCSWPDTPVQA